MRFGEQRVLKGRFGMAERLLFRAMGVADPAHYLHARYFQRAVGTLRDAAPRRILDAGCGRGDYSFYLARRFPGAQVLGVDLDAERIGRCRAVARELGIPNVRFEVMDLAAGDLPRPFDLVVTVDVLEHIADQEAAIRALAAALAPGGAAFFHLPTVRERPVPLAGRLAAFHAWGEEEHVAEERTAAEFVELVRRSGLETVSTRRTFGRLTGELATSLFALPFRPTLRNRLLQGVLAPVCRLLAAADVLGLDRTRYAVAVLARRPARGVAATSAARASAAAG